MRAIFTTDASWIAYFSREMLYYQLFRTDGVAQHIFRGDGKIHTLIYLPGIAWVADCTWKNWRKNHAYTHPDYRCQGIAHTLWEILQWQNMASTIGYKEQ